MAYLEPSLMLVAALFGLALVIVGLPGTWLMLIAALLLQWWRPETFSWWTIGVVSALAIIAEIVDVVASAVGAGSAGGSRRSYAGAIVGGIVGAVVGTPIAPIVGTILGGVVGAGVGAALTDRTVPLRTWRHSARVGQGAAIGRLISVVVKMAIGGVIAAILIVAAAVV